MRNRTVVVGGVGGVGGRGGIERWWWEGWAVEEE